MSLGEIKTSVDDVKLRMLKAAGPVFAEKGYQGASVREICEAAGVNQAAINYHFGGKESLYCETFRLAHPLAHPHEKTDLESVAGSWQESDPPELKLRKFIQMTMTMLMGCDHGSWEGRLIVRQMFDPVESCQQQFNLFIEQNHLVLRGIISELLGPDEPTTTVQRMAFSVMGQCLHYRFGKQIMQMLVGQETWDREYQIPQLVEHITSVCLAAVGRGPAISGTVGQAVEM